MLRGRSGAGVSSDGVDALDEDGGGGAALGAAEGWRDDVADE